MKKTICLCVSLLLLLCCMSPAFAAEKTTCDCSVAPIIYVGPLGCADIVRDAGTENEQKLWKTDTAFLLANAKKILPTVAMAVGKGDIDLLGDAIVQFVDDSFGSLALDENGNSQLDVTVPDLNVPSESRHGIDTDFYFNYDFRLDPYIHAERLHEVIAQIMELTGHNTVQLRASSMGGVVLSAYLDRYGDDNIETIVCQCCPLWGTAVAGELFCGKLELNATSLRRYAQNAIPYLETGFADSFIEGSLYALTDALRVSGVWSLLTGLGSDLIEKLGGRIYDEVLIPIFGSMPGIWSFVPAEYFDEAVRYMGLTDDGELYNQIMHYRTAQANIAENLCKARANGVKTYIFCGYNVQRTPLVSLWKSTSDGTVDTKYASLGAVCGDTGMQLNEDYLQAMTDKTYLSPDCMIDASECALPDCTWFIRDWLHCNGNDAISALYKKLHETDEQLTVNSMEEYPQFLQNDDDAQTLTPVTGFPDAKETFKANPTYLNLVRLLSHFFYEILGRLTQKTY